MDKIEKIRQYIESLYDGEAPKYDQQCDFSDGYFTGLSVISNFLDTLSEEPDKSLGEAAEEYASINCDDYVDYDSNICFIEEGMRVAFKAGAEWQKSQIMKGSPVIMSPENFQGLIDSHAKRVEQDYKEQLLKGAVEGDYDCDYYAPAIFLDKNLDGIKDGDKVKLIIIKDDE